MAKRLRRRSRECHSVGLTHVAGDTRIGADPGIRANWLFLWRGAEHVQLAAYPLAGDGSVTRGVSLIAGGVSGMMHPVWLPSAKPIHEHRALG